jgi:hypothetical protein
MVRKIEYHEKTSTFTVAIEMPPAMFRRLIEILSEAEDVDDETVDEQTRAMRKLLSGIIHSSRFRKAIEAALGEDLYQQLSQWWLA